MDYVVAKPFQTTLRRLAVGATVNDGDDLSPHSIESLRAAGLIAAQKADEPLPAAAPPSRRAAPASD